LKINASNACAGLVLLLGVTTSSVAAAQTAGGAVQAAETLAPQVMVTAGRSRVLTVDFDVVRIAVTNPAIADATAVDQRQVLVDGKTAGTVSLIIWGANRRIQYDVVVAPPPSSLQQQLQTLFPGEDIRASVTDEVVVLTGRASNPEIGMRAVEIAKASNAKLRVVNMLQRGANESQQVMLEVRFAEVNRSALTELAVNLLAMRSKWSGRSTTQQFPAPFIDASKPEPIQVPDYLNLFFQITQEGILGTVKALQQRGDLQTLAEPNLIAYNGQEASFLAGGEIPIPIVQGSASNGAVTVQYKEFGVRLKFTPTIMGDTIRLKVRPEVSSLDFANGLRISGFTVPALSSRWAETDVELRDGQSFAIAGLLNNTAQDLRAKVPVLGSLPIIGNFFKSKSESSQRTELLVLITPRLVRPLEPAEVPRLPIDPRRFIRPGDGLGDALEGGGGLVDAPAVTQATGGR
jgi:pilus assembly protein CpaC